MSTGLTSPMTMVNKRQKVSSSSRFVDLVVPIPRLVSKKQTVVVRMRNILSH
jgi:hypothetical protein